MRKYIVDKNLSRPIIDNKEFDGIHFKVFEVTTNTVIKETNDEREAFSYLKVKDLSGKRIYDYQWFRGSIKQ